MVATDGSGVYMGTDECRIYWVEWKTRNASPAKKSRDDNSPATGRNVKPVQSASAVHMTPCPDERRNNRRKKTLSAGNIVLFFKFILV